MMVCDWHIQMLPVKKQYVAMLISKIHALWESLVHHPVTCLGLPAADKLGHFVLNGIQAFSN